jgi:16S rRNA (guanine527-N7)-methyltransferase
VKQIKPLSDERIELLLRPYGGSVGAALCEQMRIYISTLLFWNEKISLTTVTDPEQIVRVHFGESFFAARVEGIAKGRVADIGTGAGFPGIPIRMVSSEVELTLVEPVAKKTAFLGEVVRKIGISGVSIIRCRMEEMPVVTGGFDFVTARALGQYERLLQWAKTRLAENGRVILLIGEGEVERLAKLPDWQWQNPVRVPETEGKLVFAGINRKD